MDTLSFENIIRMQFDSLMKLIIRRKIASYYKTLTRRSKHEKSFYDMSEFESKENVISDEYPSEYMDFSVSGYCIRVLDEKLGEALERLSEGQRNIVLMFYYLDMSDSEIAGLYNLSRSTIFRRRKNALTNLKIQMKGNRNK